MSNAGSKRPAADANADGRKKAKTTKDLMMDVTMGNLWEHRLSKEDDKDLTKYDTDSSNGIQRMTLCLQVCSG